MMKRLRESIRKKWNDNANILGLFFGLAVLVVLLPGILSADRLGTVDNGRYEPIMLSAGLSYTEEDLADPGTLTYNRVIEEYEYGKFSYWKLFAPNGENSIIYPIALIRTLTQPFGLRFSTVYLALIYAVLFALGTYVLVRSCGYLAGWLGVFPGLSMLMAASSPNLAAFFNSLYPIGTVIVGLLLMIAMALRLFTYGSRHSVRGLALFLASSVFCLNSSDISILFAPFVLLVVFAVLIRDYQEKRLHVLAGVVSVIVMLAAISSSSEYLHSSRDTTTDASAYHAAFLGFLQTSETPEKDLADFGLDKSYLADIGKSFYMGEDDYAHNPRSGGDGLFEKLNEDTIGAWYLRHPLRLLQAVNQLSEDFNHLESNVVLLNNMRNSDSFRITRFWNYTDTLLKMFFPKDYSAITLFFLLDLAAAFWLGYRMLQCKHEKILTAVLVCTACAFGVSVFGYSLMHYRYQGSDAAQLARVVTSFGMLMNCGLLCTTAGDCIHRLSAWFRAKQMSVPVSIDLADWHLELIDERARLLASQENHIGAILSSRGAITLVTLLLACGMSAIIQFAPERAGCVNNGDYGRMMEQLGLTWSSNLFYNTHAQAGQRIIEEYAFLDDFDWTSLTFLNPKYSLIYPTALVRLFCSVFHLPFSTWYLSILMNIVLILCIVSIIHDLFPLLGKYTMLLSLGLCGVFLCESYVVWFNSLFGESCMFMGLFMVIACSVHLAVTPPGKSWFWVILLILSGRILICAKAQMLVALPFVLLLVIFFGLYQRPLPLKGLIPYTIFVMISCVILSGECIQVYNDNSNVSERQTVWQATFYGALMISDDPESAMDELGIDKSMMPDIGKDAYRPDDEYVISPNTPEADAALYDHVNTFTMVRYYLHHPIQLLKMLNHAASVSRSMYNGFRVYGTQDYTGEHDEVQRLGLWMYWRSFFTCGSFFGYVLVYCALIAIGLLGVILNRRADVRWKMLMAALFGVMLIGAVQYPLSVIGNGFADNHKQMFGFMMCHDFLVIFCLTVLVKYLREHGSELPARFAVLRKKLHR